MRRRRELRVADIPKLLVGGVLQIAGLFGGRYSRTEGAHVLVVDEAARILAVRTTYMGPGWMLPGGRLERDETPHHGAARETREETGLEVAVERLLLVDGRTKGNVSFVFGGRVTGGTLEPQLGEIAEVGWLRREEIARTSEPLGQLIGLIEAAGDGVAYLGLHAARD